MTRLLEGPDAVGQLRRFATVLRDIRTVYPDLDPTVEREWDGERESTTVAEKSSGTSSTGELAV